MYIHEVDGVSTIKIPAVLLGMDTLEEKERQVITHNCRMEQRSAASPSLNIPEGFISCSDPQVFGSA